MNPKFNVLVVEDEENILNVITQTLTLNHYKVIKSETGRDALSIISSQCPDLILLDLGLPDMDGLEIIKNVRTWSSIPIIVVSARSQETEKVEALDHGADDYITKPFGTSELLARLRTSLRHSNRLTSNDTFYTRPYHCNELEINFEKRLVHLGDEEIHLTPVEYKIVAYLAQNSGKVITHSALMTYIWGPYADADNKILRVNMANIRRKLEQNPATPQYLFTEVGVGYRMKEDES